MSPRACVVMPCLDVSPSLRCRGGHGRTGTVIAIMLGLIYNLSPADAMWYTQFCHDMRACPMGVPSPQTEEQRHQVVRILNNVRARRKRQQDLRAAEEHKDRWRSLSPRDLGGDARTRRPSSSRDDRMRRGSPGPADVPLAAPEVPKPLTARGRMNSPADASLASKGRSLSARGRTGGVAAMPMAPQPMPQRGITARGPPVRQGRARSPNLDAPSLSTPSYTAGTSAAPGAVRQPVPRAGKLVHSSNGGRSLRPPPVVPSSCTPGEEEEETIVPSPYRRNLADTPTSGVEPPMSHGSPTPGRSVGASRPESSKANTVSVLLSQRGVARPAGATAAVAAPAWARSAASPSAKPSVAAVRSRAPRFPEPVGSGAGAGAGAGVGAHAGFVGHRDAGQRAPQPAWASAVDSNPAATLAHARMVAPPPGTKTPSNVDELKTMLLSGPAFVFGSDSVDGHKGDDYRMPQRPSDAQRAAVGSFRGVRTKRAAR